MRTAREHKVDRAVARVLASCGSYLLPDASLREEVTLHVVPPPTTAELDNSIRWMDSTRCILGIQGETGTKWKLTDAGRAWQAEHS